MDKVIGNFERVQYEDDGSYVLHFIIFRVSVCMGFDDESHNSILRKGIVIKLSMQVRN